VTSRSGILDCTSSALSRLGFPSTRPRLPSRTRPALCAQCPIPARQKRGGINPPLLSLKSEEAWLPHLHELSAILERETIYRCTGVTVSMEGFSPSKGQPRSENNNSNRSAGVERLKTNARESDEDQPRI